MPTSARDIKIKATMMPLTIPEAIPVPYGYSEATLYGIGIDAIAGGLVVFVEAYQEMALGDLISVFWDDSSLPFGRETVVESNLNHRVEILLAEDKFIPGDFTPYYTVKRTSSAEFESSPRNIRVKLDRPGGANPIPDTPVNNNFSAPAVSVAILQNGVGPEEMEAGVTVTIPVYPGMAEFDYFDFYWGGVEVLYVVQPDQAGNPVDMTIDISTIQAAGDGSIPLKYRVIDAGGNLSDGWSPVTEVTVYANSAVLDAPLVAEANDGVLELVGLEEQPVTVQVIISDSDGYFTKEDTLTVFWDGVDNNGNALPLISEARQISTIPAIETFSVPYDTALKNAGGYAVINYTLLKADGSATLQSKHTRVDIFQYLGELDAPEIIITDPVIDFIIYSYPGRGLLDIINVQWAGNNSKIQIVTLDSSRVPIGDPTYSFIDPSDADTEGYLSYWVSYEVGSESVMSDMVFVTL